MPSNIPVTKVYDATSGVGSEFKSSDGNLTYRFAVEGSPSANIKAFYIEQQGGTSCFMLKVSCANWNSAKLKLQAKSSHEEDNFKDTKDNFTEDELKLFYY